VVHDLDRCLNVPTHHHSDNGTVLGLLDTQRRRLSKIGHIDLPLGVRETGKTIFIIAPAEQIAFPVRDREAIRTSRTELPVVPVEIPLIPVH
jgi:hypothetical protein